MERLYRFLNALGMDVEIVVKPTPKSRRARPAQCDEMIHPYDPATWQFTQQDPIGIAGGMNLYGFAGGDPVNFSDPFGLCVPWPACALAAANAGARVGTVLGGGVGGILGLGGGAIPGAALGYRIGWLLAGSTATATAAWAVLNESAEKAPSEEGDDVPTADHIISADNKGSIRRRFPGEMLDKTRAEIDALARAGDSAARTARKLLNDRRFDKERE